MAGESRRSRRGNRVQQRWSEFSDKHLLEDTITRHAGRWAPRLYRIPVVVPTLLITVALFAWTVFVLLARLSGFHVEWWWPRFHSVPAKNRGDLIRDTLGVVALFGAVLAAIYAYRKQRIEEAAGYRLDAEGLSQRYQDAAEQLGHDKAAVRLAGVYAMARLADEWPEERQTCINVLCAYLRMPWPLRPDGSEELGEAQVRTSIVESINDHVGTFRDEDHPKESWSDAVFNFDGAELRDFTLMLPEFQRTVTFRGTTFTGTSLMYGPTFDHALVLKSAKIRGSLSIQRMSFGHRVDAQNMHIEATGSLDIAQSWVTTHQGTISLDDVHVEGRLELYVHPDGQSVLVESKDLFAERGAFVAVDCSAPEGTKFDDWFTSEGWEVRDHATIWLPERPTGSSWLDTNVAPDADLNFGSVSQDGSPLA